MATATSGRVRWGFLGAARIASEKVIPAIQNAAARSLG
jgi:hypothetical protein